MAFSKKVVGVDENRPPAIASHAGVFMDDGIASRLKVFFGIWTREEKTNVVQ